MPRDIQKIIDAGYEVKEFKPWHHHVYHNGGLTNVWHTTKKYMRQYDNQSTEYTDIQELIDILGEPTPEPVKEPLPTVSVIPQDVLDFHDRLRGGK